MSGPIERIVLSLDAASENHTAIDTAVRLAERTKAPLHGVFVEDEDLLRLASLPFARQVTLTGGTEPFTSETIELHLRAAAQRVREKLFAKAKRHQVKCSFETVRGDPASAVSGVSERDLVVVGATTRPVAGHFRVEWRWWSSIEAAPGPFLLARNAWSTPGSVVILLRDRSAGSIRLFEAAAEVAAARDSALAVICPPAVAGAPGFDKWIADRVAQHSARVRVELATVDPAALRERLVELDCRLLVFEAELAEGREDWLRKIVERFTCDVLVVR